MKNKKIIARNLPISDIYTIISLYRSESVLDADYVTVCANCDKTIVNVANIQNQSGKTFEVGLDCMKTLTQSLSNLSDYEVELMSFNSALRFYGLLNKADKIIHGIESMITVFYTEKDKKKSKSEFRQNLDRFKFDMSKFEPNERERQAMDKARQVLNGECEYIYFDGVNRKKLSGEKGKIRRYYEKDGEFRLSGIVDIFQIENILHNTFEL